MSFELLTALNGLLENGFSQTRFRVPDKDPGIYSVPQFFIGGFPPVRKNNDAHHGLPSRFPYFLTRFSEGEEDTDASLVSVNTYFGIYTADDEEAGQHDITNMVMRAVRLIRETELLDRRFELQYPFKWHFGDTAADNAQPHPYHEGVIKTTWRLPVIERILTPEMEESVYGNQN